MTATHPRPRAAPRAALAAIATLLVLLPFAAKPVHVDDALFVWTAQQVVRHPLDPYGFTVNWDGHRRPMVDMMQNPPLAAYGLAAVGAVAGWGEVGLHLAAFAVAAATVAGVYRLAATFCRRPALAAALVLACPGFLVSATTLMADVPLLCLWTWATLAWVHARPVTAGTLVAAAVLTKYPGVNLIPLLALHAVLCPADWRRARVRQALSLLIPVAVAVLYDRLTAHQYGQGLLSAAGGFAARSHAGPGLPAVARLTDAVGFAGGTALAAAAVGLATARRWTALAVAAAGLAAVAVAVGFVPHPGTWAATAAAAAVPGPAAALPAWAFDAEFGLFATAGVAVAALAAADLARSAPGLDRRLALFLVAWVAGVFTFTVAFNWAINARTLLPLVPPACVMAARAVDRSALRRSTVIAIVTATFAVTLAVTVADDALARANRRAAADLSAGPPAGPGRAWFQGHWGFQYYMQLGRATPVDAPADLRPGDRLVLPLDNYGVGTAGLRLSVDRVARYDAGPFLATMNAPMAAAFYGSAGDALPFAVGLVPPEPFVVTTVLGPATRAATRPTATPADGR